MAYTPRTFSKYDPETSTILTRVSETIGEDVQLVWEGWTPGTPTPPPSLFTVSQEAELASTYVSITDHASHEAELASTYVSIADHAAHEAELPSTYMSIVDHVAHEAELESAYVSTVAWAVHAPALGLYFPEAEGALADGTTDDTTAIQATLTLARAAKGQVRFQAGKTYIAAATLNPAGATMEGYGAILKQKAGITGVPMFQSTTGAVNIHGLTLDGNRANTTAPGSISTNGAGVYVYRSAGGELGQVVNLTAYNLHGPAVRVGGTRNADARDNNRTPGKIDNLRCWDSGYGIFLDAARDVKVVGGTITDVDTVGIQDNYGCDNSITGTTVDGTGTAHGIISQYSWGFGAHSCRVRRTGTELASGSGAAASGIQIGGGDVTYNVARSFTISNCVIEDAFHYGISIDPTLVGSPGVVQTVNGTITGNVCENNGTRAFALDPVTNGGSGIYAHNAGKVTITGNHCRGNHRSGIIDDGLDNSITGNSVVDNLTYGVEIRCASGETKGRTALGMNTYRSNGIDLWMSEYSILGDLTLPIGLTTKTKAAGTTRTNTVTVTADPDLTFPNLPPGAYEISGVLIVDSSIVADVRFAWSVPTGTDLAWTLDSFATGATSTANSIYRAPVVVTAGNGTIGTISAGAVGAGVTTALLPKGRIRVGTQGTVSVMWAQGTLEATNTILSAGSYIRLARI